MREQIKITVALDYDADAARAPADQIADCMGDVARLLDPDSTTGVELISAAPVDHKSESQMYSGEARGAFTRSGFKWFTVQRCREITDATGSAHIEACGWHTMRDRADRHGETHGEPFWSVYGRRVGEGSQAVGDFKSRAVALLMADALADGRAVDCAVDCADSMLPGFRVTWETVTDASAEHGDAEARGFFHPVRDSAGDVVGGDLEPLDRTLWHGGADSYAMPLRAALEALQLDGEPWRNLETLEPDSSDPGSASSVRAIYNFNGPAGDLPGAEQVRAAVMAIHFPENITPASRARLVKIICK